MLINKQKLAKNMKGKIQEKQENERVSEQLDLPEWIIILKQAIEDHNERRKLASNKH